MVWMFFYIVYEVLVVHIFLKRYGFGETIKLYLEDLKNYNNISGNLNFDQIKKIILLIDKVCFMFWGNAECLHRSLVGFKILRKQGVSVELVVGVKKFPFSSHAWLELNNEVINDLTSIKDNYIEILRAGRESN